MKFRDPGTWTRIQWNVMRVLNVAEKWDLGQIYDDVTPKFGSVRESPQKAMNSGLGNICMELY